MRASFKAPAVLAAVERHSERNAAVTSQQVAEETGLSPRQVRATLYLLSIGSNPRVQREGGLKGAAWRIKRSGPRLPKWTRYLPVQFRPEGAHA
jgi:hypothetical protein